MIFVQQNTVRFLQRLGKMEKRLDPGIHFYLPILRSVTSPLSLKETVQSIEHQDVITKDNVKIAVDGYFYYKVVDPYKAQYDIEDFQSAITTLSTSVSRSEIGKATLDEIFQHRDELNDKIKIALNEATHDWGVECLNYEILKLDPPEMVQKALTEVAMAERTRRQMVIRSEADREYEERKSAAQMNAGIIAETAKLEAALVWNEELRKGLDNIRKELDSSRDPDRLMNYLLTEEYLERLEKILQSKKVVVLPEDGGAGGNGDSLLTLSFVMANLKGQSNGATENQIDIDKLVNEATKKFEAEQKRRRDAEENDEDDSFTQSLAGQVRQSTPYIT
jgi:regulator of protease activity HflC (stomatin/prohibitin superfamily)